MPRIKIKGKNLAKSQFGGECPEGYKKNEFNICIPDFESQYQEPEVAPNAAVDFAKTMKSPSVAEFHKQPFQQKEDNATSNSPGFWDRLGKVNSTIDGAFTMADMALSYFDKQKKQKDYDKKMAKSMQPHNYYAVDTSNNRGDYDINDGMFRPDQMGYKSKGTQANPYYGSQNFAKFGGLLKAKDGMAIKGDTFVQSSFIPDAPLYIPPRNTSKITITEAPSNLAKSAPTYNTSTGSIKDIIAAKESGGNYKALPWMDKKHTKLASSAVGKYQFLWKQHKDWIGNVTGVKSKEDFMNNPEAQEAAFDYWDKTVLTPNAEKIKKDLGVKVPLDNIKYSIHFAGPKGAYDYFSKGKETTDAFGSNVAKYAELKISENGGQNNNSMKIKITESPDENQEMAHGGQPKYAGQSNYGLYIGQRDLYKTMAKHPHDDPQHTVSEKEETPVDPYV